MLAAMVADGSVPSAMLTALRNLMPSVEDRLPAEPYVIQPFESIGSYGGTLNLIKFFDYFWGAGFYMHLETMLAQVEHFLT